MSLNRFLITLVLLIIITNYAQAQTFKDIENQAVYASSNDNHNKVVELTTQAIELDPNQYYPYELRAKSLVVLGKKTDAMLDFTRAIQRGAVCFYERGQLKRELGDYRGAINDFTKAININPTKNETHYPYREFEFMGIKQAIQSRALFSYDRPYFFRGVSYFDSGQYEKSINDFSKIIDLTPEGASEFYITSLFNRGYARVLIGQKESGCNDLSKAGEYGFSDAYEIIRERC